jgi:hypothetical protein
MGNSSLSCFRNDILTIRDKNNRPIDIILETQTEEQPLSDYRNNGEHIEHIEDVENVESTNIIETDLKSKLKSRSKAKALSKSIPNQHLKRDASCPGFELDSNQDIARVSESIENTEKILGVYELKNSNSDNGHKNGNDDFFSHVHYILYPDNSIYIGTYDQEWLKEGNGTLYLPDGSKYTGQFKQDYMNGEGRLIYPDGDYYEGLFLNNKPHGHGIYGKLNEGFTYTGNFIEGVKSGFGEEKRQDESFYKGEFLNDLKHGNGQYTWPDGSVYQGQLKNNEVEGFGRIIYFDYKIYLGSWKNNKIEGLGIFYWPDGKIYAGYYKNDKKCGFGIFLFANGKKYEGYWLNGKQHGLGIISFKGIAKLGEWRFGKRIRWILNDINGTHAENENNISLAFDEISINNLKENINEIKIKSQEISEFLKGINIQTFEEEEIKDKLINWEWNKELSKSEKSV